MTSFGLFLRGASSGTGVRAATALAALCPVLAVVVGGDAAATALVADVGLAVVVPFAALLVAERATTDAASPSGVAALWLRGEAPWRTAGSAWAAALAVVAATAVVGVTGGALLAGSGATGGLRSGLACVVAAAAYTALALPLALRVRNALIWGLAYVLVWEGAVAAEGPVASALSIRHHALQVAQGSLVAPLVLAAITAAGLAAGALLLRPRAGAA